MLEPEIVTAIEEHRFPAITHAFWRNSALDLSSTGSAARESRCCGRHSPELVRARVAEDHAALTILARDQRGARRSRADAAAVALLWETCQIPDFRKILRWRACALRQARLHRARAPPWPPALGLGRRGRWRASTPARATSTRCSSASPRSVPGPTSRTRRIGSPIRSNGRVARGSSRTSSRTRSMRASPSASSIAARRRWARRRAAGEELLAGVTVGRRGGGRGRGGRLAPRLRLRRRSRRGRRYARDDGSRQPRAAPGHRRTGAPAGELRRRCRSR